MRKLFPYIFFIAIFNLSLSAQMIKDTVEYSPRQDINSINSQYEKHLNIHVLRSQINYNLTHNNLFFNLNENYNSTIVSSMKNNIKDEHSFSLLGEYYINPLFSLGITVKNNIYSDNRNLDINQVTITNSTLFSRFTPYKNVYLKPFGGASFNRQVGEHDNGIYYGAEMGIDSLALNEFTINSTAAFSNEDISPRRNLNRSINFDISNRFENSLLNRISGSFIQQRKDFYFAADSLIMQTFDVVNNIQSRTESNYYLEDQLVLIPSTSNLIFSFHGRVDWRTIDRNTRYISLDNISSNSFDTNIEELKVHFASSASYVLHWMSLMFKISFIERDEKHSAKNIEEANPILYTRRSELEFQKNNRSQQTSVSLSGNLLLSPKDIVTLSLMHRKLEYNTPSDENFDDRDELLTIISLGYNRKINSLMNVFVQFGGSLNHLVYIFSERSSNNNKRRVFKLSSGASFAGKKFHTRLIASVSADYTSYDFQDFNPYLKSYSFRKLAISDSSSIRLTNKISASFDGYINLSEQGDFSWDEFSSKPSRYVSELFLQPKLHYTINHFSFGLGVKYFSLITYGYENTSRKKQSEYSSFGPMAELRLINNDNINVSLQGWYEFISNENDVKKENINANIRVNWIL